MTSSSDSDKLIEGLLGAFDKATLAEIVQKDLERRIWEFVPDKELATYLVKNAEEQGWTSSLVDAALKNKPEDAGLKKLGLLDPLQSLIAHPSHKSVASGSEVARVVRLLIQVLEQSGSQVIPGPIFTELNDNLTDLYEEYKTQSAGITAA
jgi:hypothetical protein